MQKLLTGVLIGICFLVLPISGASFQNPQETDLIDGPEISVPVGLTDPDDLETFLDGIMRIHQVSQHIAGATFVAVKDGAVFLSKGYGFSDIKNKKPVLPGQTLFRPGSVSKLFIWTAVMQQVEQGRIDLNEDINTYLEEFQIPDTYPEPITMSRLMAHTSGFEETVVGMAASRAEDLVSLKEYLADNIPERVFPPGLLTAYSNYGSALAAYVVEKVTGTPFDEYLEQNIFAPLGMNSSTFRQPLPQPLAEHMSGGYRYARGVYKADEFELINGMYPAGSLSTTAGDMAKFMIAFLQLGRLGKNRILDESTVRLMQTRLYTHDAHVDGNAHGFWEWTYNGLRTIQHGGDTLLFHSFLVLIPEHNTGFFVSYNSVGGGGGPRMQLMEALLDRYFPSPDPDTLEPPEDFAQRANRFSGLYMLSRVNYSSFIKIMQPFSTLKVCPTQEGTLLVGSGASAKQYIEVEPLVFRELEGRNLVVFKENARGRITHMFLGRSPYVAGIKMQWHQKPLLHIIWLGISLFFFVSTLIWPLGALRRRMCRQTKTLVSAPPRAARVLAGGMSALCLIFFAGMIAVFSHPDQIIYGIPFSMKVLLVLPFAAALLALGVLALVFLSWIRGYWDACSRLHYLLVFLSFPLFLWFLDYWNLLGFKF